MSDHKMVAEVGSPLKVKDITAVHTYSSKPYLPSRMEGMLVSVSNAFSFFNASGKQPCVSTLLDTKYSHVTSILKEG